MSFSVSLILSIGISITYKSIYALFYHGIRLLLKQNSLHQVNVKLKGHQHIIFLSSIISLVHHILWLCLLVKCAFSGFHLLLEVSKSRGNVKKYSFSIPRHGNGKCWKCRVGEVDSGLIKCYTPRERRFEYCLISIWLCHL